jgi:hypothetical protein
VVGADADAFSAAYTLKPVQGDKPVFPPVNGPHRAHLRAGGLGAVVTGTGKVPQPGRAVGFDPLPGLKGDHFPEELPLPEVVFVFTGYLAGLAGDAKIHIEEKTQSFHTKSILILVDKFFKVK